METQTFTASISREDNWFIAQCLEVDIASQGESEEGALVNLREALELYFEPPQPSVKSLLRRFENSVGAALTTFRIVPHRCFEIMDAVCC